MKLAVTGFKDTGTDSFDHIYFFKATMNGDDLVFELTNSEIAEIIDCDDKYNLPGRFDFGVYEPIITDLLRFLYSVYWRDEDGVLNGCAIELTRPEGV
jgi:hypothetical protein